MNIKSTPLSIGREDCGQGTDHPRGESEKKIAMFTFAAKMCKTVSVLVCEERLCFIVMVVTAVAERGVVLCTTERAPEQAGRRTDRA